MQISLTSFINNIDITDRSFAPYEVLENQDVTNENIFDITVSGSLFSYVNFKHVVFRNVDFYSARIENCTFENCEFINCNFQFSDIVFCDLRQTNVKGCSFDVSNIRGCNFFANELDEKARRAIAVHDNRFFVAKESSDCTATMLLSA